MLSVVFILILNFQFGKEALLVLELTVHLWYSGKWQAVEENIRIRDFLVTLRLRFTSKRFEIWIVVFGAFHLTPSICGEGLEWATNNRQMSFYPNTMKFHSTLDRCNDSWSIVYAESVQPWDWLGSRRHPNQSNVSVGWAVTDKNN